MLQRIIWMVIAVLVSTASVASNYKQQVVMVINQKQFTPYLSTKKDMCGNVYFTSNDLFDGNHYGAGDSQRRCIAEHTYKHGPKSLKVDTPYFIMLTGDPMCSHLKQVPTRHDYYRSEKANGNICINIDIVKTDLITVSMDNCRIRFIQTDNPSITNCL